MMPMAPLTQMVGQTHHAPPPAPAVARRPQEVLEAARRLAAGRALDRRFGQLAGDLGLQSHVARQAEQVIDAMGLAPCHQGLAGEAGIGAQYNAHVGPAAADLADDPLDLLARTGRGVDVGRPQLGRQEMAAG